MSWKEKGKQVWPYILVCIAAFYLPPIWIEDTGLFMVFLLALLPFICFAASMLWAMKAGFDWTFSIAVGVIFLPSIFIFYNSSAWVYSIVYGVFSLVGVFFGNRIVKKMQ